MSEYDAKVKKSFQPKCPSCGAALRFDAENGRLVCDHCDSAVSVERDFNVRERDFSEMDNVSRWKDSDVMCYRCANCGASTVLPRTTLSSSCPFCNSPVVMDVEQLGTVRPDTVIPFEVSAKNAVKSLERWRKHRYYAPKLFRKSIEPDAVKGIYLPVWTFDSYTSSAYRGRLGKNRTRTVTRNGKTYSESYVEWFTVSGVYNRIFDDVYVRGSNNVSEKYLGKLQPFPQSKYVVYNDAFLAGYMADNYTVDPKRAFEIAVSKMKRTVENEIVESYNADVVGDFNIDMDFDAKTFKYLMLPVYVNSAKYRDKVYSQYVSGVFADNKGTVKVAGKSPVSPLKVTFTVLAGLALIAAIILILFFTGNLEVNSGINPDEFWEIFPKVI